MKNNISATIFLLLSVLLASCSGEDIIEDNEQLAMVYIPSYGFTVRPVWEVEGNNFVVNLDVYCSGLREGSKKAIEVGYEVDESLIDIYNTDQQYAGEIEMLPSDCYSFASSEIEIPKGEVQGHLRININTGKLKDKGVQYNKVQYAIPIRLKSCSTYKLHNSEQMLCTLVGINFNKPVFYFWNNRNNFNMVGMRLLYSSDPSISRYMLVSEGVPMDEDYTATIEPDPSFLDDTQQMLPNDAWKLESNVVTFEKGYDKAYLPITIFSDKIDFQKIFYLPLKIASVSKYSIDEARATLLLKLEVKNDYEWTYISKLTMTHTGPDGTGKSTSKQIEKKTISLSKDSFLVGILDDESGWYDFTGYWLWIEGDFDVKVIETENKNKWNVELIANDDSPYGFEPTPGKESYFDWDNETFHFFYRFRGSTGYDDYIEVEEILEAQHS